MIAKAATVTRTPICQNMVTACDGEFSGICTLPAGHAGQCEWIDAMGLCLENDDCRAYVSIWAGQSRFPHNHR